MIDLAVENEILKDIKNHNIIMGNEFLSRLVVLIFQFYMEVKLNITNIWGFLVFYIHIEVIMKYPSNNLASCKFQVLMSF